jgi:hypothetical protein
MGWRAGGRVIQAAGGGSATPQYVQLTDIGSATLDGNTTPILDSAAFAAGVFTFEFNATVATVDGYGEAALPRYVIPLTDILPAFDPTTDILDVVLELVTMPVANSKRGVGIAVLDGAAGGGPAVVAYDNGATTWGGYWTAALPLTGGAVAGLDAVRMLVDFGLSAGVASRVVRFPVTRRASSAWADSAAGSHTYANDNYRTPSNLHLLVGAIQASSGSAAAQTVEASAHVRRIPRGALL